MYLVNTKNVSCFQVFDLFNRRFTHVSPDGEDLTFFPVFTSGLDEEQFEDFMASVTEGAVVEDRLGDNSSCTKKEETSVVADDVLDVTTGEKV